MAFSVRFHLDNMAVIPPPEAKQAWVRLLERIDEIPMQLEGFERMDRVELAFLCGGVEVRRVDTADYEPRWTTPIVFAIGNAGQAVEVAEARNIRENLAAMMGRHVPVPAGLNEVAMRSFLVVGVRW